MKDDAHIAKSVGRMWALKIAWLGRLAPLVVALLAPSGAMAAEAAASKTAYAENRLADQWEALNGGAHRTFRIDEASSEGLFGPMGNDEAVIPLDVLMQARALGDLKVYFALRQIYRPNLGDRQRRLDGVSNLLGYAGLAMGYAGLEGRNSAHGTSPNFDNFQVEVAASRPTSVQIAKALGAGGCEADAIVMLTALSKSAGNGANSVGSQAVARDARRVLHDLGMFAFHPSTICDRPEDASLLAVKQSLTQ
jgi:hypothetical protein